MPNHHILIVEDNATHRAMACEILKTMGYQVSTAGDGYAALAKLQLEPQRYDLVLMDWEMPGMNGLDTVREIRTCQIKEGWPHIPIIAFTANKQQGDSEKCLAAGMDDYIPKDLFLPKWHKTLADKITNWIKTHGANE